MVRIHAGQPVFLGKYLLLTSALTFPLTVYEGFFREHQYGMSNQSFGGWLGDFLKGLMVALVLGSIALIPIFALVRRRGERWHLYASAVGVTRCAQYRLGRGFPPAVPRESRRPPESTPLPAGSDK